jgi:N-acetylglucosaminyl-diphospho-decaprenol L-rhamnosyltransferase
MSPARPSMSVVIPTHDTRALTLACLTALLESRYRPAEIFVVDDGGTDGSAEAVRERFPSVHVLRRERAGGFTAAVNDAWPRATSEIVLLLNSDTTVDVEATARMADAFARDPRLGVAGASLVFPDGRPQWSAGGAPTARWLFVLASGVASMLARIPGWRRLRPESQARGDAAWVPATAMGVRAAVVRDIGWFDSRYETYVQDLDFCLRARAAGWRVAQLPDVRVTHLRGATIGAAPGAVRAGWSPDALVGDFERWIRAAHPPDAARTLTRALDLGLSARLLARTMIRPFLAGPFRPRTERDAWARETARYRVARDRLRRAIAAR